MEYIYKHLGSKDVPVLKQLLKVFADAFDDSKNYLENQPDDEYLKSLLANPNFIALVAMHGGEVVGGLCAYVLEKFEQARSEVYIYDLAVALDHRRQGIATALINNLKPIAKNLGAWVIYVQADPPDEPAVKLYEKLGTKEEVFHFDIPID